MAQSQPRCPSPGEDCQGPGGFGLRDRFHGLPPGRLAVERVPKYEVALSQAESFHGADADGVVELAYTGPPESELAVDARDGDGEFDGSRMPTPPRTPSWAVWA